MHWFTGTMPQFCICRVTTNIKQLIISVIQYKYEYYVDEYAMLGSHLALMNI